MPVAPSERKRAPKRVPPPEKEVAGVWVPRTFVDQLQGTIAQLRSKLEAAVTHDMACHGLDRETSCRCGYSLVAKLDLLAKTKPVIIHPTKLDRR